MKTKGDCVVLVAMAIALGAAPACGENRVSFGETEGDTADGSGGGGDGGSSNGNADAELCEALCALPLGGEAECWPVGGSCMEMCLGNLDLETQAGCGTEWRALMSCSLAQGVSLCALGDFCAAEELASDECV